MIALLFVCSGMTILLLQIGCVELTRWLRVIYGEAKTCAILHDTEVFPDRTIHPFPAFPKPEYPQ